MSKISNLDYAKKLVEISLDNGEVSKEKVTAILSSLVANPPRNLKKILALYKRLIKVEMQKYTAKVEYSGELGDDVFENIKKQLSAIYNKNITISKEPNQAMIAGFKITIADDVYENSVISRLRPLAQAKY